MKIKYVGVGIFLIVALLLFSAVLFIIGDRHKAFTRHIDLYTEFFDVNGLAPGSNVRIGGFDAGEVEALIVPDRPGGRFRLKLHLDDRLHRLIRTDSLVTVESDGIVGDRFLLIHSGKDESSQADIGATLPSKEPIQISAMIAKMDGVIDQASSVMKDVHGELNTTLRTATKTIGNVNGLISDARHGKGAVGVLLNDQETADQLKQTVANAQAASSNVNQITVQAGHFMGDIQSRNFPAKVDDTIAGARNAVAQLDQASQTVNATLNSALAPDPSGRTAAENIRDSLSNVSVATANINEDTEALKHGFLFRGFFKKRGFYSLHDLTPEQYRTNAFFQNQRNQRAWIAASIAFAKDDRDAEILTELGRQQIDQFISGLKDKIAGAPIVVEGYSDATIAADQVNHSNRRSVLIVRYLEQRFRLSSRDMGSVPLNATPPPKSGKSMWDGACIVILTTRK